jgi:hypothetical protein
MQRLDKIYIKDTEALQACLLEVTGVACGWGECDFNHQQETDLAARGRGGGGASAASCCGDMGEWRYSCTYP